MLYLRYAQAQLGVVQLDTSVFSASRPDSNTFPTAAHMVFGVKLSSSAVLETALLTGSGKSMMAADKLEIPMYLLVHKIALTFQRLYLCFRVLTIYNGTSGNVIGPIRKKPKGENPR